MATIKDIATHLNISTSTVSKGLNNAKDISEDLRLKILDTAISLNYKPKRMKSKETQLLCIFVRNMNYLEENQFGYELIRGFKESALYNNFEVQILDVTTELQSYENYDRYMFKHGYKGGFFIGFTFDDPWIKALNKTITPTVVLDNPESQATYVAYVGTDNMQAINLAIKHLKTLGHHHIGFLNGHSTSKLSLLRTNAFTYACKKYNMDSNLSLIKYGDYSKECAKKYVNFFLNHHVTAIMCGSDTMAIGMIEACNDLGYKVPEDVSIVGFDDLPLSAFVNPPLTTIHQNRRDLGKLSFSTLNNLINGVYISQTLLRPRLIVRQSTLNIQNKSC